MIPSEHANSVLPLKNFRHAVLEALATTPEKIDARRELPALLAILASLAIGLVASWERWGNPLVDSGRELNVPLRLLHGEMLYSDVSYLYGPLSPYLNALLYQIFHPALWTIWGHGIAATLVILALTYWLARQIMGHFPATLACIGITWVCALKPQGNYMLAYSFGGLDGCAFVLAATAACVLWLKRGSRQWAIVAGISAALAMLSKTELGITALCVGMATAVVASYPRKRAISAGLAMFLVAALGISVVVFGWFAGRVGWKTLAVDNHLFFGHVPWQLVYFNGVRFGFDRPWHSIALMLASLIRFVSVGGLLAALAIFWARLRDRSTPETSVSGNAKTVSLVSASIAGLALTAFGLGDLGPLMPMPILLMALGWVSVRVYSQAVHQGSETKRLQAGISIVLIVSALACLARIFLRVSTGGALSSFLVPISIVLFVYLWLEIFPALLPQGTAPRIARQLISAVLMAGLLATAVTLCARYRRKFDYALVTPRGTWRVSPEHGIAFQEALQFIEKKASSEDTIAVFPEGTSLNFFTGRRNPLREEITTPGFLDAAGEEQAIERLRQFRTPIVLITNRLTLEFGQEVFGKDYHQRLFSWIEENYRPCAMFGFHVDPQLNVGSSAFFIRAYCLQVSQ